MSKHCCFIVLGLSAILLAWTERLAAQDTSSLEAAMRSRVCPADRTKYDKLTYREYGCKTICDDSRRNGEDRCGGHLLVGYEIQCQREVDEKNKIIGAYNQFIIRCPPGSATSRAHPSTSATRPPPPSPSTSASPSALERAVERQRTKTKDADKAAEKSKADAEAFAKQSGEEMTELQEKKRREELEEVRRNQEKIRKQIEAEYIPPGWEPCKCPTYHQSFGKWVRGVLYHGDVGNCP